MLSKGFFLVSSFWVGLHGNAPQDWVGLDNVQLNGDGLLDDKILLMMRILLTMAIEKTCLMTIKRSFLTVTKTGGSTWRCHPGIGWVFMKSSSMTMHLRQTARSFLMMSVPGSLREMQTANSLYTMRAPMPILTIMIKGT